MVKKYHDEFFRNANFCHLNICPKNLLVDFGNDEINHVIWINVSILVP